MVHIQWKVKHFHFCCISLWMLATVFHNSDCRLNCVVSTTVSNPSLTGEEWIFFQYNLNVCAYKGNWCITFTSPIGFDMTYSIVCYFFVSELYCHHSLTENGHFLKPFLQYTFHDILQNFNWNNQWRPLTSYSWSVIITWDML